LPLTDAYEAQIISNELFEPVDRVFAFLLRGDSGKSRTPRTEVRPPRPSPGQALDGLRSLPQLPSAGTKEFQGSARGCPPRTFISHLGDELVKTGELACDLRRTATCFCHRTMVDMPW